MKLRSYFYNCSKQYITSISPTLLEEVLDIVETLPKRPIQSDINCDLFWLFGNKGWSYDTTPKGLTMYPPSDIGIDISREQINGNSYRNLCITSSTLDAKWHADFAKEINGRLVQIEAQFGKIESMFKDFCGFKIAFSERRLALGIEIVISYPLRYFAHRKSSIAGMAYFDIAERTLMAIGLDCPIWLIGIEE